MQELSRMRWRSPVEGFSSKKAKTAEDDGGESREGEEGFQGRCASVGVFCDNDTPCPGAAPGRQPECNCGAGGTCVQP